jgi:hypothetical protein
MRSPLASGGGGLPERVEPGRILLLEIDSIGEERPASVRVAHTAAPCWSTVETMCSREEAQLQQELLRAGAPRLLSGGRTTGAWDMADTQRADASLVCGKGASRVTVSSHCTACARRVAHK